jgi:hypothetical protein
VSSSFLISPTTALVRRARSTNALENETGFTLGWKYLNLMNYSAVYPGTPIIPTLNHSCIIYEAMYFKIDETFTTYSSINYFTQSFLGITKSLDSIPCKCMVIISLLSCLLGWVSSKSFYCFITGLRNCLFMKWSGARKCTKTPRLY